MKRSRLILGTILAFALLPGTTMSAAKADGQHFSAVGGGAGPCEAAPHPSLFNDMGVPEAGICYGGPNGEHFDFSAHLAARNLPSAATGHVVLWFVNNSGVKVAEFHGPVTCLMSGPAGVASITFQATKASGAGTTDVPPPPPPASSPPPSTLENQYLTFSVLDGTANGQGEDRFSPPSNNGTTRCGTSDAPLEPVNFGQIRVGRKRLLPI
jgi:hypothetical protein